MTGSAELIFYEASIYFLPLDHLQKGPLQLPSFCLIWIRHHAAAKEHAYRIYFGK